MTAQRRVTRKIAVYCDGGSTRDGEPRHAVEDLAALGNFFTDATPGVEQWGPLMLSSSAQVEWPDGVAQSAVLQNWPADADPRRVSYVSEGTERVTLKCRTCDRSIVLGDSLGQGWPTRQAREAAELRERVDRPALRRSLPVDGRRAEVFGMLSRVADAGVSRLSLATLDRILSA